MKIAVTGHTVGIGKSIADTYRHDGHEIIGFSTSTGYNIATAQDRARIVAESVDCDIFFNNAYHDFAQCDLLFELWESWQGQKKKIVNISSSQTMRWLHNFRDIKYRSAKRALEDSSEFLWNKSSWPAVVVAAPTMTDTPRTAFRNDANKVDPDQFARLLKQTLDITEFRVQMLKLAVEPIPGQAGFSPESLN